MFARQQLFGEAFLGCAALPVSGTFEPFKAGSCQQPPSARPACSAAHGLFLLQHPSLPPSLPSSPVAAIKQMAHRGGRGSGAKGQPTSPQSMGESHLAGEQDEQHSETQDIGQIFPGNGERENLKVELGSLLANVSEQQMLSIRVS